MKMVLCSVFFWICFLIIAIINGAFREFVMIKMLRMDILHANQWSCLTGIIFWTTLLSLYWKKLAIKSFTQALSVGTGWFFATALFETFIIDRNLTWSEVMLTYDFSSGNYWGLVLLWLGLMPIAIYTFLLIRIRKY